MKKTLNLIIATFLVISAMGQPTDKRALIKSQYKQNIIESFHNLSSVSGNSDLLQFSKTKNSQVYQSKSTSVNKQKLDSIISETWDTTSGQWIIDSKSIYKYDNKGNSILEIAYDLGDSENEWIGNNIEELSYDINNFNILRISYNWDIDSNKWGAPSKEEISNDGNGNISVSTSYSWNEFDNKWVTNYRSSNFYDVDGNKILSVYSEWDENFNIWYTNSKSEYTFDENGNNIVQVYNSWNSDSSRWEVAMKSESYFDSNGNDTLDIGYYSRDTTTVLKPWFKQFHSYDAYGNWSMEIMYEWNETDSLWNEMNKAEYNFDNSYTSDDLYYPYYFNLVFKHKIIEAISYENINSIMVLSYRSTCYYSDPESTSTPFISAEKSINVYPNPASDFVTFKLNGNENDFSIELFDYQGRKVISQMAQSGISFSVQNLAAGMYVYKLNDGKNIYTGKLIVE
jgi:uncharacterized protein YkuJ